MKNNLKIDVYSAQSKVVLETIKRDGCYYVKGEYIDAKYEESAFIFQTAYSFMNREAERLMERPKESESLIWVFKDKKWTGLEAGGILFHLQVPVDEVIFFDREKWNRILNLSYIGTEQEQTDFDAELVRIGAKDTLPLFKTAFYPLQKRRVMNSWQSVFDIKTLDDSMLQGGLWKIDRSWIKDVHEVGHFIQENG